MMEDHEFCDHCPGCRPALVNAETGEVLMPEHPTMIAVNKVWDTQTTFEERKGFIEVTLHNSRSLHDTQMNAAVMQKIENALAVKH